MAALLTNNCPSRLASNETLTGEKCEHFSRVEDAADVQRGVLDRADLEHVPAAGNQSPISHEPLRSWSPTARHPRRRARTEITCTVLSTAATLQRFAADDDRIRRAPRPQRYSFLDGASQPEELAARAAELGYKALALTDHDGVYGSLEFAHAAKHFGVRPITGAELTLAGGVARDAARRVAAGLREPLPAAHRRARAHAAAEERDGARCRRRSTRRCSRS